MEHSSFRRIAGRLELNFNIEMAAQAKAKVRKRREEEKAKRKEAIALYEEWKKTHPHARTQECFDAFDIFMDSVLIEKELQLAF